MKVDQHSSFVAPDSLNRMHEAREPRLRAPIIIVISVATMVVLCLLFTMALTKHLSHQRPMRQMQPLGLLSAPNARPLTRFPGPNLQLDDGLADSTALREKQTLKLNSYGWVDRSNGIVHIPIDRAMELLVAEHLPTIETNTNGSRPLLIPTNFPAP